MVNESNENEVLLKLMLGGIGSVFCLVLLVNSLSRSGNCYFQIFESFANFVSVRSF